MIEFDHISKRFPGVAALSDVSFAVRTAECHALLGENGAGKSTLGKIVAGLYRPDSGRLVLHGEPVSFGSPRDALAAGVGIVHQELVFCPNLSVAENLCLHDLPQRFGRVDWREMQRRAEALLAQIGLAVDVRQPVSALSIAQEQMVQIAAAIGLGAKILIFDEPTSSLGRGETERLFSLIRRLQSEGVTVIYVSHRLEEIFELCQTVTVLRDGRHVATMPTQDVDHDELVRLMVGRAVEQYSPAVPPLATAKCRLRVRRLTSPKKFGPLDLEVHAGEIVGLAGLVGAGRTELAEAVYGLDPQAVGTVEVDGCRLRTRSPRVAQSSGVSLIPEDRKSAGLVLSMNVRENATLPVLDRFRRLLGAVARRREAAFAREVCTRLNVRAPGLETSVNSLSGGNQQKVVFAKGTASDCRVLLIDEPTRGVDVGAKREIHELIGRLAEEGVAILLISSDLPELLALAHRVVVLRQGQIVASLAREQAEPETILRAMTGLAATG